MAARTKRYKVVGVQPVLGHASGQTFEASLDRAQEDFLVGIGALSVVQDSVVRDRDNSK